MLSRKVFEIPNNIVLSHLFYVRSRSNNPITFMTIPCTGLPTDQSARVARNTQLILQEETGICDVADPWGGSYMMESLTDELYQKAKTILTQIEEKGGMTAFINNGHAKLMIEESATKKQGRIDSGKETVVGVNKYRLSEKDEQAERVDVLQIDNSDVREKQIARMNEVKASRDEALAQASLAKLEASARMTDTTTSDGDDPNNLMRLCIDCARLRYVAKGLFSHWCSSFFQFQIAISCFGVISVVWYNMRTISSSSLRFSVSLSDRI